MHKNEDLTEDDEDYEAYKKSIDITAVVKP